MSAGWRDDWTPFSARGAAMIDCGWRRDDGYQIALVENPDARVVEFHREDTEEFLYATVVEVNGRLLLQPDQQVPGQAQRLVDLIRSRPSLGAAALGFAETYPWPKGSQP